MVGIYHLDTSYKALTIEMCGQEIYLCIKVLMLALGEGDSHTIYLSASKTAAAPIPVPIHILTTPYLAAGFLFIS